MPTLAWNLLCFFADGSEERMDDFLASTEAMIATWHGISPPNEPALRFAADLASTIAAFEAVRGTIRFEDEPSSFEQTLADLREKP